MIGGNPLPLLIALAGRVLCRDCANEHCDANPTHRGTEREPTKSEIGAALYSCAACDCTGEQALRDGYATREPKAR
jgi:hypothetical protein